MDLPVICKRAFAAWPPPITYLEAEIGKRMKEAALEEGHEGKLPNNLEATIGGTPARQQAAENRAAILVTLKRHGPLSLGDVFGHHFGDISYEQCRNGLYALKAEGKADYRRGGRKPGQWSVAL